MGANFYTVKEVAHKFLFCVSLFLYYNGSTDSAEYKHYRKQRCVRRSAARFRRAFFGIGGFGCNQNGLLGGYFVLSCRIVVISAAILAIPILNVALGGVGCRLG